MRVAAWNIQQGAPKRGGEVVSALLAQEPDLVVLTEFHPVRSGVIVEGLGKAGFRHLAASEAGYGYQVLLASRLCLSDRMAIDPSSFPVGGYVQATVEEHDIVVAGVYAPVISAVPLEEKRRFWAMLHQRAEQNRKHPYIVIGDWNTGDFPLDKESALRPFSCTREYRQMTQLGFEEAWRTLNPTVENSLGGAIAVLGSELTTPLFLPHFGHGWSMLGIRTGKERRRFPTTQLWS